MIWYTYDANRKPIWFTAYAPTEGGSNEVSARIREEYKTFGQPPTHRNFGEVKLRFIDETRFDFSWNYNGRHSADEMNRPLVPPGASKSGTERVHLLLGDGSGLGGQWFDPTDPGWGFSIETSYGLSGQEYLALYYFDQSGRPVWASGLDGANNGFANLDMYSYTGFCQGCPAFQVYPTFVGTIGHTLSDSHGHASINIGWPHPWRPNNGYPVSVINLLPDPD